MFIRLLMYGCSVWLPPNSLIVGLANKLISSRHLVFQEAAYPDHYGNFEVQESTVLSDKDRGVVEVRC